ncbi:hypothetical protein, partial [Falsiruegeria litorea]|uniref:hypothetical protein n=1 Tax=Falsiruegeria litorea TaxID=1280831 RepID=UPI001A99ABCD
MKLTPYHRSTASLLESSIIGFAKGVDIQTLIHRNEPNRPHISSVYYQCQTASEPKVPETKTNTAHQSYLAQTASILPRILSKLPILNLPSSPFRPPRSASAPPVKGVLVLTPNTRNPKIHKNHKNIKKLENINKFNML